LPTETLSTSDRFLISVELHTRDIPDIYASFARLVGERAWTKQADSLRREIRGNRFLEQYLLGEFSLVLALDRCAQLQKKYGAIPAPATLDRSLYAAMSFASQVSSMVHHAPAERRAGLISRVRGAMNNNDDLHALLLELQTATHFIRQGHSVTWPEIESTGRIDLLLPNLGPLGLQVECKAISADKGRKVHRRDALMFHHLLSKEISTSLRTMRVGHSVVLSVPERLPTAFAERKQLAASVKAQIHAGASAELPDGCTIRITEFDPKGVLAFDEQGRPQFDRTTIDQLTSTKNREVMIRGSGNGALVFVLQSTKDDSLLQYLFKTLKTAADRQFDNSLPALFVVGLNAIATDELTEIAGQDIDRTGPPTALRLGVSDFLSSNNRKPVIGVAFLSRSELANAKGHLVHGSGTVYYFPKQDSPLWNAEFKGLFPR